MNRIVDAGRWLPQVDLAVEAPAPALDLCGVHDAHADFVWASLQRLGVSGADLDDLLQEVFVVVHQRLDTFDGSVPITAWLFGICRRVAAAHRRRAYVRGETAAELPEARDEKQDSEQAAATGEAREKLDRVLDEMDVDRRVVFVMYELDEMSCESIALVLDVPIGTVYSRLHAARKAFEKALARVDARETRRSR